jgi:signal transduction histidine kinase
MAPDLLGRPPLIPEELGLAVLGTVPVCFTIAIIQHRLFDIDLALRRGLFFGLLAGVSILFYELTGSWLATATAAVLVAVLFEAQESQRLNRMKSFFLAGVSHDLKTPLANIRMYAELLRGRPSPKERTEFSEIVVGETDRLTRLIDNVLDFSRIEGGTRTYMKAPADLNAIVGMVLATFRYQFKIGGFKCAFTQVRGPLAFQGDQDAVAEALVNLLSNALKYSGSSKKVTVTTFRKEGWVGVTVADEGLGIDPSDQKRVFEPFLRLGAEGTRAAGGAGLGLALVRHIVEGHRGKIELESAKGQGSRFTLLFPMNA